MDSKRGRTPQDFDHYRTGFPRPVQRLLQQLRAAIRKSAPQAEEKISYGIPAFTFNGMLVWFAAHKRHIGFYPGAAAIAAFKRELAGYKSAKGSVQFPLDRPLPLALVGRMVKYRVKQNLERARKKK